MRQSELDRPTTVPGMPVLHVINSLSAGGAELHLLTLCRHLKAAGYPVSVACLREHIPGSRSLRPTFSREGFATFDLRSSARYEWRFPWRLANLVRRERPALLHTHQPRADFAGWVVRLGVRSCPWVTSVHTIHSDTWSGKRFLPLMRFVWKRADAVIAISDAVRDWLVGAQGLSPEKVRVVHYGIDAEGFLPPHDGETGLRIGTSPVIGAMGRLVPSKGHETLIRALPLVLERFPQARLRIAGYDPDGYGAFLRSLAADLGIAHAVEFAGFQQDVPGFLRSVDLFAFPSRSEGFGQVLVEAMAAGKAVVASRIAPITEIVKEGDSGLLVERDDPAAFAVAIGRLVSDPEEAREMGRRGQARIVREFSAERMSERTIAVYRQLSARARAAG